MLLQEPVQAAIWDSLNHYAYTDATFLAERLYAEVSNDDALHLVATCYYRSGKPIKAYMTLQKHGCPTPQCKYLLAKCCMDMNKLPEAESVLAGNIVNAKSKTHEEIETEFGGLACHVFSTLGAMYSKTERISKAIECYRRSLSLNPLLWSSFERLCQLGDKTDPVQVFHCISTPIPTQVPTINIQAPLQNLNDVLTPQPLISTDNQTPQPLIQNSTMSHTPENFPDATQINEKCPRVRRGSRLKDIPERSDITKNIIKPLFLSPLTPSFGFLPLDTPSPAGSGNIPYDTPSPMAENTLRAPGAPRRTVSVRGSQNHPVPPPVLNFSGNNTNTRENQPGIQNNPPPVRRSSRLFGSNNSSSVKENNKSHGTKTRLQSPKALGRKSKTRSSKSQQELNKINKSEPTLDSKPVPQVPTQTQILQMQQQSLTGILHLLQCIGKAYQALSQYDCKKAIEMYQDLPIHQYNTAYVLCQLGRAYFELSEYQNAERLFGEARSLEPYHLEGMEIFSTTLWHLQREVELSALAQELTDMEKNSPEAWCATGNCFSLQKEHDTAIKFFQRAIQVDPNFAYAFTLLGHEYVFTEELDKAMSCFRNAIRVDPRHFNAWYGVGMIYYKQEKFDFAEVHFRKALHINPHSAALLCHIGVVQHAQQKSESALSTLNKAIATDPRNPLCKFHRASILFASDKHNEALKELEELKQIVPKESLVYFLIGKVHKKLGNTHFALMNFSWAMDLDPKGINNQIKEAIDKRYVTEDDESLARLNDTGLDDDIGLEDVVDGNEDLQLQAIESDESL
ncbi:cell division cycle protein 27 homolog [Mytilus californianus]|uniref:cell division cycle protein 27 homolog n=1 Tax=Mytilus californianus TaxID=6549 RepID=UPI0022457C0A|nr:cell division cycle protein 27 homolog [Mytilus californianus]